MDTSALWDSASAPSGMVTDTVTEASPCVAAFEAPPAAPLAPASAPSPAAQPVRASTAARAQAHAKPNSFFDFRIGAY